MHQNFSTRNIASARMGPSGRRKTHATHRITAARRLTLVEPATRAA